MKKFKEGDIVKFIDKDVNASPYGYLVIGHENGQPIIECRATKCISTSDNDFLYLIGTASNEELECRKYTPTTKPSLVLYKIGSEDVAYGRKDEDFEFARSQDEQYCLSNMKSEKDQYKEEGITSLSGIEVTKTPLGEAYSFELPVINEKLATAAKDRQEGGEHYKVSGIEPSDVIDTWPMEQRIGYYRGNLLTYTMRCGFKDAQEIEIKKSIHYAEKLLETLAEKNQRER